VCVVSDWIDPNGGSTDDAVVAFCDHDTDVGGWTLVAAATSSSPSSMVLAAGDTRVAASVLPGLSLPSDTVYDLGASAAMLGAEEVRVVASNASAGLRDATSMFAGLSPTIPATTQRASQLWVVQQAPTRLTKAMVAVQEGSAAPTWTTVYDSLGVAADDVAVAPHAERVWVVENATRVVRGDVDGRTATMSLLPAATSWGGTPRLVAYDGALHSVVVATDAGIMRVDANLMAFNDVDAPATTPVVSIPVARAIAAGFTASGGPAAGVLFVLTASTVIRVADGSQTTLVSFATTHGNTGLQHDFVHDKLYWLDTLQGELLSCGATHASGSVTVVATVASDLGEAVTSLALDATAHRLYLALPESGRIVRADLTAATLSYTVVATGLSQPQLVGAFAAWAPSDDDEATSSASPVSLLTHGGVAVDVVSDAPSPVVSGSSAVVPSPVPATSLYQLVRGDAASPHLQVSDVVRADTMVAESSLGASLAPEVPVCGTDASSSSWLLGMSPALAAASCHHVLMEYTACSGGTFRPPSGTYWIRPTGRSHLTPVQAARKVYCDMETEGGGWTLVAPVGVAPTHPDGAAVEEATTAALDGSVGRGQAVDTSGLRFNEVLVVRRTPTWCGSAWHANDAPHAVGVSTGDSERLTTFGVNGEAVSMGPSVAPSYAWNVAGAVPVSDMDSDVVPRLSAHPRAVVFSVAPTAATSHTLSVGTPLVCRVNMSDVSSPAQHVRLAVFVRDASVTGSPAALMAGRRAGRQHGGVVIVPSPEGATTVSQISTSVLDVPYCSAGYGMHPRRDNATSGLGFAACVDCDPTDPLAQRVVSPPSCLGEEAPRLLDKYLTTTIQPDVVEQVISSTSTLVAAARDCGEVLALGYGDSGWYEVYPEGATQSAKPVAVYCDQVTAGGGWSLVATSLGESSSSMHDDYLGGVHSLVRDSAQVLLSLRDAALVDVTHGAGGAWAVLGMPDAWRERHPASFDASEVVVPVTVAGEVTPMLRTVVFGAAPQSGSTEGCGNATSTATVWGQICVPHTPVPSWSNFAHPANGGANEFSTCAVATARAATRDDRCHVDRQFTMWVRRTADAMTPMPSAAGVRSTERLAVQAQASAASRDVDRSGAVVSSLPRSCVEVLQRFPSAASGWYDIHMPDADAPSRVFCDLTHGGWQLCAVIAHDLRPELQRVVVHGGDGNTKAAPMVSEWTAEAAPGADSDLSMSSSWSMDCSRWLRPGALVSISNSTTSATPLAHSAVLQSQIHDDVSSSTVAAWRVDGRAPPVAITSDTATPLLRLTSQRMAVLSLPSTAVSTSSDTSVDLRRGAGLWGQARSVVSGDACGAVGAVAGYHMCHGNLPHANAYNSVGWDGGVAYWVRVTHDDVVDSEAVPVPKPHTCLDVRRYMPHHPSGPVALWPSGDDAPPVLAECDMGASGEEDTWTVVFTSDSSSSNDASQYRSGLGAIVASASEVRIAVSDAQAVHRVSASSSWVAFPLPEEWRTGSPMASRVPVDRRQWPIRSASHAASPGMVRWGRGGVRTHVNVDGSDTGGVLYTGSTAQTLCLGGAWMEGGEWRFNDSVNGSGTNTSAAAPTTEMEMEEGWVTGRVCAVAPDTGIGSGWVDLVAVDGSTSNLCSAAGDAGAVGGGNLTMDCAAGVGASVFSIAVRHVAPTTPTTVVRSDDVCPDGWSLLPASHKCFKAVVSQQSMEATRTLCAPGDLASVTNGQDNVALAEACATDTCWLGGGSDGANDMSWLEAGEEWRYSNFAPNEPSSVLESCLEVDAATGLWNDVTCWANKGGVCTLPATPVAAHALPRSCAHALALDASAASGMYTVYPLGDVAFAIRVYCDMDTVGGGWSVVLAAHAGDTFATSAGESRGAGGRLPHFSPAVAALMSDPRNEVLMAWRADADSSSDGPGLVMGDDDEFATFAMPAAWRHRHPLLANAEDVHVTARVGSNSTAVHTVLRFGHGNVFGTGCDGNWTEGTGAISSLASPFGRVCLRNTSCPVWSGFAAVDAAATPMALCGVRGAHPESCSTGRWFTLAVRPVQSSVAAHDVQSRPMHDLAAGCSEAVATGSRSGMYAVYPAHQTHAVHLRSGHAGATSHLPRSCADVLLEWPSAPSGMYTVLPPQNHYDHQRGHYHQVSPVRVYCDMASGGAMLCGTVGVSSTPPAAEPLAMGLENHGDGSTSRGRRTPGFSVDCSWALVPGARVALSTSPTDSRTDPALAATLVSDVHVESTTNATEGVYVAPAYRCAAHSVVVWRSFKCLWCVARNTVLIVFLAL